MSRLADRMRQLLFPPEFRIQVPDPDAKPFVPQPRSETDPYPSIEDARGGDLSDVLLADIATNIWLTRRVLPPDEFAARHHLLVASDKLAEAGLEIHDFDGATGDVGMSMEVVGFETRPDVLGERVLETIRPAIYRHGRCIQIAQVIVAHPETGDLDG